MEIKLNNIKNRKYYGNEEDIQYFNDATATKDYLKAYNNCDLDYLLNLIYGCEFDIEINKNGTLNLVDLQGVYLGDYETYENLPTITDAIKRLECSFLNDYFGIYAWHEDNKVYYM